MTTVSILEFIKNEIGKVLMKLDMYNWTLTWSKERYLKAEQPFYNTVVLRKVVIISYANRKNDSWSQCLPAAYHSITAMNLVDFAYYNAKSSSKSINNMVFS